MAFNIVMNGHPHEIAIVARRPDLIVRIDGRDHVIETPCDGDNGEGRIVSGRQDIRFVRTSAGGEQYLRIGGRTFVAAMVDPASGSAGEGGGSHVVKAPMPGAVVSVHKVAGDAVVRGEAIVTIESMKLQTALGAPRDGVIEELAVNIGDVFEKDAILVRLEVIDQED